MADIVTFEPPANQNNKPSGDMIYCCANCGCTTWMLQPEHIKCAYCGNIDSIAEWRKNLYPDAKVTDKALDGSRNVVTFSTANASLNYTIDEMRKRDPSYLIYICDSGFVGTWGRDCEKTSDIEKQWMANRFTAGVSILAGST